MDSPTSGVATPTSSFFDIPVDNGRGEHFSSTLKSSHNRPADPTTLEGQRAGAMLVVKRFPRTIYGQNFAIAGDFVIIEEHSSSDGVQARNLRTGFKGDLCWEDLLPVPYDGKCICVAEDCRCVYETLEEFSRRRPRKALELKKAAPVEKKETSTSEQSSTEKQKTTPLKASDPMTLAGQTPGAILQIKQRPYQPDGFGPILHTDVGDFVKCLYSLDDEWGKVMGRNIRTGKEGYLRWECFKPVNTRTMCSCRLKSCYCVYEDHQASEKYCGAKPAS